MIHNFTGIIYFNVKQLTLSGLQEPIRILISKSENEKFEEILVKRQDNNEIESEFILNELFEEGGGAGEQWKGVADSKQVKLLKLYGEPCNEDFYLELFLCRGQKQLVGICRFPIQKMARMPKVKHELEIEFVEYQKYMQVQNEEKKRQLRRGPLGTWEEKMFKEEIEEQKYETKPYLRDVKEMFKDEIENIQTWRPIKHNKVASMSLNLMYLHEKIGRLVFERLDMVPTVESEIAQMMEPELIIRIDHREIRSSTFKVVSKSKIIWHKRLEAEITEIPTKISIVLFNRIEKEEEAMGNLPVFKSNLLLPSATIKREVVKMSKKRGNNTIHMGEIVVKYKFDPYFR